MRAITPFRAPAMIVGPVRSWRFASSAAMREKALAGYETRQVHRSPPRHSGKGSNRGQATQVPHRQTDRVNFSQIGISVRISSGLNVKACMLGRAISLPGGGR